MSTSMDLYVVLAALLVFVSPVSCVFSRWLKNTDLNNPSNWDRGSLPCGNDRMILPDDGPVVFMQLNTTIRELVMPRSGEVVFGSFAALAFTDQPDHSAACLETGSDILFNASQPADWFDPMNWCGADSESGPCQSLALLDTERIPCATDDVIFPRGSSYYVNLRANFDIQINTLKVSGKAYSTNTFQDFVQTDNGQNIFPRPQTGTQSTLTMNRRRCTDQSGCSCGNDQPPILTAVCEVQRSRCRRPRCSSTLTPVGHCCEICGAILNITYGTGFNLDTLRSGIQRNFLDDKLDYKDVQYIVYKKFDGGIQMVLTDIDGVKSSKVAMEIRSELQEDISTGGHRYGLTKVVARMSVAGPAPSPTDASKHTGGKSGLSGGSVAGVTIASILGAVLVVGSGFFLYKRKYRSEDDDSGFTASVFNKFNRFNASQKRKPQVSVPPSVGYNWGGSQDSGLSSVSGGMSLGFDNPIYGTPMEDMKSMEMELSPNEFGTMSEDQPKDVGFDNPLYDTDHQESLFSDATVVEKSELPSVMTLGGKHETDA